MHARLRAHIQCTDMWSTGRFLHSPGHHCICRGIRSGQYCMADTIASVTGVVLTFWRVNLFVCLLHPLAEWSKQHRNLCFKPSVTTCSTIISFPMSNSRYTHWRQTCFFADLIKILIYPPVILTSVILTNLASRSSPMIWWSHSMQG